MATETKAKARSQTIQAPAKNAGFLQCGSFALRIVSCAASRHGAVGTGIPEGQAQEEFLHLGAKGDG